MGLRIQRIEPFSTALSGHKQGLHQPEYELATLLDTGAKRRGIACGPQYQPLVARILKYTCIEAQMIEF